MAEAYDVVNDGLIATQPPLVWAAILAEFNGAGAWWAPYVTFDHVDGVVRGTIHTRGDKRGLALHFTGRTRVVAEGRCLVLDYTSGAFRGSVEFTLDPCTAGTRMSIHWRARPHGWVSALARIVNIGAAHSRTTQDALTNLSTLFAQRTGRTY